jgi:hypothetical protein
MLRGFKRIVRLDVTTATPAVIKRVWGKTVAVTVYAGKHFFLRYGGGTDGKS